MADNDTRDLSSGPVGRRLGVGAAFQFVGIVVQQVLKFLTNWLIARLLGASTLGLFNYGLTFWSSVEMSFSGGLVRTIMRYLPHHIARQEEEQAAAVVRLNLLLGWLGGGVLGLLMYLLADLLAVHLLGKPETAPVLRLLALAMPLAAVSGVGWATARSLGSLWFIVYQFMLLPAVFVLAIPFVAWRQGGASGLAWGFVVSYALPLIPLLWQHRRLTAFLPERAVLRPVLRACLAFLGVACLMWFAEFVARNIDLLLMGRLRTNAETGIYTIASRTATLPSMVMVAFNAFFSPTVSALYAHQRLEELRSTFSRASLWILIVGAPPLALLMALAQPVMAFFRPEFTAGALALWILCAGQVFNLGTGLISTVLMMADRQHSVLYSNLVGMVISGGLCLWLIPVWGVNGAALATAVTVVLVNLAQCWWGYRTLRVSPLSRSYPKPLLAALVAGLATSLAAPHCGGTVMQLVAGTAVFLVLYVLALLALGAKGEAVAALRALRPGGRKGVA